MDKAKCFITEKDQKSVPEQILANTIRRSYRYAKDFSDFADKGLSKKEPFVPDGCLAVWKVFDEFQTKQQAEETSKRQSRPKKRSINSNKRLHQPNNPSLSPFLILVIPA